MSTTKLIIGTALVGSGVAAAVLIKRSISCLKEVTLTYFDIPATPGEKVRLALTLARVPFKDIRIKFSEWAGIKPETKYGQLPMLQINGEKCFQSGAILRHVGRLGDGSLYPVHDPEACMKIEECLGIGEDLARAWMPALMVGFGDRHEQFGHPKEWPDKVETTKRLREKFVQEELPSYMGYLSREIEANGGSFLCGCKPTIADCHLYPQVQYFVSGTADHVPKDCLKDFPVVLAWMERFRAIPEVAKHYGL